MDNRAYRLQSLQYEIKKEEQQVRYHDHDLESKRQIIDRKEKEMLRFAREIKTLQGKVFVRKQELEKEKKAMAELEREHTRMQRNVKMKKDEYENLDLEIRRHPEK